MKTNLLFIEGYTTTDNPATAEIKNVSLWDYGSKPIPTDFGRMDGMNWVGFDIKRCLLPVFMDQARKQFGKCPHPESVLDLMEAFRKAYPLNIHSALHYLAPAKGSGILTTEPTLIQLYRYMTGDYPHDELRRLAAEGEPMDAYGYIIKEGGKPVLSFGKYRGKRLEDVLEYDRDYIDWCISHSSMPEDVIQILKIEYDRGTTVDWLDGIIE